MKLLLQSAMIFFGTLMAAGLVALGEPGGSRAERIARPQAPGLQAPSVLVEAAHPWVQLTHAPRGN